jgi:phosphoribosylglycinamide formyltransferase 1
MKRVAILISGRGSNMAAILDAVSAGSIAARVVGVISNRPDAAGLALAATRGVAIAVVDHQTFSGRNAFENALAAAIDALEPDVVVLAGFMRILSAAFVDRYGGRLINIHPSLLPAYPGLDTHRRALADGVKIHGCTVHFVTADVDHGPIIAQAAVPVHEGDSDATLAARVLEVEHRVLVAAVRWFCEDRLVSAGRGVRVKNAVADMPALMVPVVNEA